MHGSIITHENCGGHLYRLSYQIKVKEQNFTKKYVATSYYCCHKCGQALKLIQEEI